MSKDETDERRKYTSLQGEPYGNNQVLSKEGKLLCKCSRKRANWYLTKGLATIVSESPNQLIIKLIFDAGGPGCDGDDFCLGEKKNMCVVCGTTDELSRHHIVPYGYRKFFPMEHKDHNAHDVLLLCLTCHHEYEEYAREYKKQVAEKYGAPYHGECVREMHRLRKAYNHAKILLSNNSDIPNIKKQRMYHYIVDVTGHRNITEDTLAALVEEGDSQDVSEIAGFKTHEQIVVSHITDLEEFVRNWRQHFIVTMKPKFMPSGWSIDYQHRYNRR